MAQISAFLFLKVGGNDIGGESSVSDMAGVDVSKAIECIAYEGALTVGFDPRSARPTGDRSYDPIRIQKLVDKASPELANAACLSKPCVAEVKFFRPSETEAGIEHFFTVKIEDARIARLRQYVTEGDETASLREEVEFVFPKITWKHEVKNTEHSDDWKKRNAA